MPGQEDMDVYLSFERPIWPMDQQMVATVVMEETSISRQYMARHPCTNWLEDALSERIRGRLVRVAAKADERATTL
jgi:hypothetical protein